MKKSLILLLVAVLALFSSFPISADAATAAPTYIIESKTVVVGEVFTMNVSIANNPGIISLNFNVEYDSEVMELLSVSDSGLLKGYTQPSPTLQSPYTLRWVDSLALSNNLSQGTVVVLTFRALKTADASTVKISHINAFKTISIEKGEEVIFNDASAVIRSHEHAYNVGVITKFPSCIEQGVRTFTCVICNGVKTEAIAVTGHNWINATCTEPMKCTVCGATHGAPLPHTYTETVTQAPTCAQAGVKTFKCGCGASYTETIAALPHTWNNATCTEPMKCAVCGTANGAALGHSLVTDVKKATVSADGSIVTKCAVCGVVINTTKIAKIADVELSATEIVYNGKVKTPDVEVYDANGNEIDSDNYTVTYASGRKNVGKYKVTVKFKGNYSGKKTVNFEILPKGTTVSKLTAAKKSLKVAIRKQTKETTGYEVQYSLNKNFKSAKKKTIKKATTTSLTIKSLKARKKYYVRVRTFKTVGKKKYYSDWSKAVSKKTK